jgi:hypothetical protein
MQQHDFPVSHAGTVYEFSNDEHKVTVIIITLYPKGW